MNVGVLGLWHQGSVTAACLAAAGHRVLAWDPDPAIVSNVAAARPPVSEPGLADLIQRMLDLGRLEVRADLPAAVRNARIVWIAFDTPVDGDDGADVEFVLSHAVSAVAHLAPASVVVVSSQWPVGTTRRLEAAAAASRTDVPLSFVYAPENLRLGRAIEVFQKPDRVIVGVRDDRARGPVTELFEPITGRLEFMSIESAEMTKHAINAFLATSVAFINEIAALCEHAGADAREVERGLKTEERIGPRAYVRPGPAFAGGTLARDVKFLRALGTTARRPTPLMDGVDESNRLHRQWAFAQLETVLGGLAGRRLAIWGLTYKPGTDTLRQSSAVELCRKLVDQGADVHVHDPAVRRDSADLPASVHWHTTPLEASTGADALVVATEWPMYREVPAEALAAAMPSRLVIDAGRFLGTTLGAAGFRLIAVGQPG